MKKFIVFLIYFTIFINVFSQKSTKPYEYNLKIYMPNCSFYYAEKGDSTKRDTTFIYHSDCYGSIQDYGVITYISENRKDTLGFENNVITLDKKHYNLSLLSDKKVIK